MAHCKKEMRGPFRIYGTVPTLGILFISEEGMALSNNHFNRKLIAPMILGSILNPINSSIISVALIPIGQAFGAPPSKTAWLISALYLATAIGQPVTGKLIDSFGPKRLFLIATSLVGLSSFIAVFAPNLWWLVAARVILGFGT
ncbi:MAG TPA: MFS transporter, partial [Bacillales bacterium]|nr:MFS transporter [Bacillales bacterium]